MEDMYIHEIFSHMDYEEITRFVESVDGGERLMKHYGYQDMMLKKYNEMVQSITSRVKDMMLTLINNSYTSIIYIIGSCGSIEINKHWLFNVYSVVNRLIPTNSSVPISMSEEEMIKYINSTSNKMIHYHIKIDNITVPSIQSTIDYIEKTLKPFNIFKDDRYTTYSINLDSYIDYLVGMKLKEING